MTRGVDAARIHADPVAVRQWVVAVALTLHAEDSVRRGSSVDLVTALVIADTAVEAALGVISSRSSVPIETDSFGEHLKRATAIARLPESLVAEIRAVHKIRNGAVHQGAEVGPADAQRAIAEARALLDVYVPRALRAAKALGHGRGIADAVATLIGEHPIAPQLVAAQAALPKNARLSLESTSEAFHTAASWTQPRLPADNRRIPTPFRMGRDEWSADVQRIDKTLAEIDAHNRATTAWVVPLALGMSPTEYAALVGTLPFSFLTFEGYTHHWPKDAEPDPDDARRSLERVAYLVLRLWSTGLLKYPRNDPSS